MQEVAVRIVFVTPCLGNVSKQEPSGFVFAFPRDSVGGVVFSQQTWLPVLAYAATMRDLSVQLVSRVAWSPQVAGTVTRWKRMFSGESGSRRRYAMHDAFRDGAEIATTAVLPDGLSVASFEDLLTVGGSYHGVSLFKVQDNSLGRFTVISVLPTKVKSGTAI